MQLIKTYLILSAMVLWFAQPFVALAADDGAKFFEEDCSEECHNPNKKPLTVKNMSRTEWKDAINIMLEKERLDPVPSKERISVLLDYLVSHFGPLDVAGSGSK